MSVCFSLFFTYPGIFSISRCTGMVSWPRKRLMIGRLFANLSFTSMYRMSVISATNVYFCREANTDTDHMFSVVYWEYIVWKRTCVLMLSVVYKSRNVTSPCQTGLVVLAMMADRRSCPWWLKMGKTLLFPGWMDIFRYGSGLKNMPFFRPVARRSATKQ